MPRRRARKETTLRAWAMLVAAVALARTRSVVEAGVCVLEWRRLVVYLQHVQVGFLVDR